MESPSSENGIMHVSVGVDVVWCVTKDRKVRGVMLWFCFFFPFFYLFFSNRHVTFIGNIGDLDSLSPWFGELQFSLLCVGMPCGL